MLLAGPPLLGPGSGRSAVPSVTLLLHPHWVSYRPPSAVAVAHLRPAMPTVQVAVSLWQILYLKSFFEIKRVV